MFRTIFFLIYLVLINARPEGTKNEESDVENVDIKPLKTTLLPFYGGAKGQSLEIIELPDGKVIMNIIKSPPTTERPREETTPHPEDVEYPSIPNRHEDDFDEPETNLRTVKLTAERLIQLQDKAKYQSPLSEEEQREFKRGVALLSETTSKFAQLQQYDKLIAPVESKTDVSDWLSRKKDKKEPNKTKEDNKNKEQKKKEDEKRKEEEEKIKEEGPEGEKNKEQNQNEESDEIAVNLPSEEASVAEAKPVGLAVAGEGGVAASRPVATAVSGKGGLAVARPVGTAIAGVDPDEALLLVYGPGASSRPSGDKDKGKVKARNRNTEMVYRLIQKYQEM